MTGCVRKKDSIRERLTEYGFEYPNILDKDTMNMIKLLYIFKHESLTCRENGERSQQ